MSIQLTTSTTSVSTSITDEDLVESFQQGDNDSFSILMERYRPRLERRSSKDARQYPSMEVEDFYSYYMLKFYKAVEKFDATQGVPFGAYLQVKLSKATYDFIKRKLYSKVKDEDGRHTQSAKAKIDAISVSLDIDTYRGEVSERLPIPAEGAAYEYKQKVEDTDFFKFIEGKDPRDAKVAALLVQGYTFEEIALMVGRKGSPDALRNWTKRTVERIKRYAKEFYKSCDSLYQLDGFVH